jgi:hypothetical protein
VCNRRSSPCSFRVAINSQSLPGAYVVAPAAPSEPQRGNVQRSLLKRVERLERDPRWQPPPPPSAADRLFRKKAQQLMREVDERYTRLVVADLQRNSHDPGRWSGLTVEFLLRAADHVREGLPWRFPPQLPKPTRATPMPGTRRPASIVATSFPRLISLYVPSAAHRSVLSSWTITIKRGSIRNQWW